MKHTLFFKVKSISNNEAISDLHRSLKCGVTVSVRHYLKRRSRKYDRHTCFSSVNTFKKNLDNNDFRCTCIYPFLYITHDLVQPKKFPSKKLVKLDHKCLFNFNKP